MIRHLLVCLAFASFPAVSFTGEMRCEETDDAIRIFSGDNPVLVYNKKPRPEAAENDPAYARTGYLHPVHSPSGKILSGDYAPDHPHQHGIFFAWTKTEFEGRAPEFWNERKQAGKVHYESTQEIRSESESAGFSVTHRWEDLTAPEGAKPVLRETWRLEARESKGAYVLDLVSEQRCAGESPLKIDVYHYGGMAVRGNADWLGEEEERIFTSEGLGRVAGNHTRPDWVRMQGELDGATCGILALPSPENFRAPQWVRLHPAKPYFVFAPMVEESFEIKPGETYRSSFRFVLYDGEMTNDRVSKFQN